MTLKNNKYSTLHLCFLLFFGINFSFAQDTTKTIPFTEAISQLENIFDVKFSYNSKVAKRITVSSPAKNNTLSEILNSFTVEENITFTIINERYLTVQFSKKLVPFCATFINTQTGKPINVIATANNKTYFANKGGVLNIDAIADDEVLQVYLDDLFVKEIVIYSAAENTIGTCPFIFINTQFINQLPTVTLSNYIAKGIEKTNKGAVTIKKNNFEILPSLIEPDVLQIAQALPGIESYDETASNINIRGGASDEVTILWNDIRMYQSGHFFGLISALNPNLIDNVIIYKNGTHPRYSEGVSGVLHMYPTNTIDPEIDGGVGVNLSSANAFIKVPISTTFAIHASGRTAINNGIGNPIYKSFFERTFQNTEITNLNNTATEALRTTDENFSFYDISISALWDITPKDKLNYHFMTISNGLEFKERLFINDVSTATFNELKQKTLLGGFNYKRDWTSNISTIFHYSNSTYKADAQNKQIELATEASQRNQVKEQTLKFDASYNINDQFSVEGGFQHTDTSVDDTHVLDSNSIPVLSKARGISNGFYLQGIGCLFDNKTTITFGGRATNLSNFETQLEPRINISHNIKKHWNAFIAAEKKHQSILQFTARENQLLAIENKQWLIADGTQNPLVRSTQISFGTDYARKGWTLSAEAFLKKVAGINTRNLGFRNQLQNTQAIGNYTANGIELSIGKKVKNLSTWLSYTNINSSYEFETLAPQEFRANFNVNHVLKAIATYAIKSFTIAAGANYHSGLPYTTPLNDTAITNTNSTAQIQYNSPNNELLKPYFRTNISAIYNARLDDTFNARINLALLNIFDTKNELSSYYRIETNNEGAAYINRITQFSLGFTPNISVQLLF
jgi:hypothetical protein